MNHMIYIDFHENSRSQKFSNSLQPKSARISMWQIYYWAKAILVLSMTSKLKLTCTGSDTPTLVFISSLIFWLPSHCISNSMVTPWASLSLSIMETPKEHQELGWVSYCHHRLIKPACSLRIYQTHLYLLCLSSHIYARAFKLVSMLCLTTVMDPLSFKCDQRTWMKKIFTY